MTIWSYTEDEIKAALDFRISRILNGLCNRLIKQRAERRFTNDEPSAGSSLVESE